MADNIVKVSNDELEDIKNYIRNWNFLDIKQGRALTEKRYHLMVFKIINVSQVHANSFYPDIETENIVMDNKNMMPKLMKKNDEALFFVLAKLNSKEERNYNVNLKFISNGEHFKQSFTIKLKGKELNQEIVLTGPEKVE